MVISEEEAAPLEAETRIQAGLVFLGRDQDRPVGSNAEASGIPYGILLLTNRRLFFLHKEEERKEESFKKGLLKSAAKGVVEGLIPLGLGEVVVGVAEIKGAMTKKLGEIDFRPFLASQFSFAVPLERIVSYKRFGSVFGFRPKNSFLRITIANEKGVRRTCCVYANVPGKPFTKIMNHGKWVKALKSVGTIPEET